MSANRSAFRPTFGRAQQPTFAASLCSAFFATVFAAVCAAFFAANIYAICSTGAASNLLSDKYSNQPAEYSAIYATDSSA